MRKIPFIYLFNTKEHKYAYDVNSNEIIRLNDLSFDYLRYLSSGLSREKSIKILENEYSHDEISNVLELFDKAQKSKTVFSEKHPSKIAFNSFSDSWKEKYDECLELLTLEVTQRCNLACKYCCFNDFYAENRNRGDEDMPWDIAQAGLDYMLKHGGQEENPLRNKKKSRNFAIGFYGGEPLLRIDFLNRCVQYISQRITEDREVLYTVTTNATLLTPEAVKFLLNNNINIVISLDGPKEIHDRMRVFPNGCGTYDKILEGIENLVQYASQLKPANSIPVIINCVLVGNENVVDLWNYFSSMEELFNTQYIRFNIRLSNLSNGVDFWNQENPEFPMDYVQGWEEIISEYREACLKGVYYPENDKPSWRMELLDSFVRDSLYFAVHGRTRFQFECQHELPEICHPGSICYMGSRRCYLTTNGTILPCERVPSNDPYFIIGDIMNGGINLDKVQEKTEAFTRATDEDCKNCWCFRMCSVGCLAGMVEGGKVNPSIKVKRCSDLVNKRNKELIGLMEVLEKNPKALDHYNSIIVT